MKMYILHIYIKSVVIIYFKIIAYLGCGGEINEIDGSTAGEITSPRFPNPYPAFLDCYHIVLVGANQVRNSLICTNKVKIH